MKADVGQLEEDIIIEYPDAHQKVSYNLYKRTKFWDKIDFIATLSPEIMMEVHTMHHHTFNLDNTEISTTSASIFARKFSNITTYTAVVFPGGWDTRAFINKKEAKDWCEEIIDKYFLNYRKDQDIKKEEQENRRTIVL